MKINPLVIGAIVLGGIIVIASTSNAAASAPAATSDFDLADLSCGNCTPDNIARLQSVANVLAAQGLSDLQMQMMLAQFLQETGLFTDNPNYNATDNDLNYAGVSYNGQLAKYNSLQDFVTDYLRVLNKAPNYPINAANIVDFNTRLKANGYYTDSATTYGNNLTYYFNLLNSI